MHGSEAVKQQTNEISKGFTDALEDLEDLETKYQKLLKSRNEMVTIGRRYSVTNKALQEELDRYRSFMPHTAGMKSSSTGVHLAGQNNRIQKDNCA